MGEAMSESAPATDYARHQRLFMRELAALAKVSPNTITRVDAGRQSNSSTVAAIRAALESAGVTLTNGGEPGIKLRKPE